MADMVKRCILFMCCVMLVSACASKRPPVVKPPESGQKAYQRPYTVLGKRYEPLQTHRGFDKLADRIKAGGGRDDTLRGLAKLTGNCVACHAMYRLDEVR